MTIDPRDLPGYQRRDQNRDAPRYERVLPHSLEAEQSTLGAMLLEPRSTTIAGEILSADDFYRENHRSIFAVIYELFFAEKPVDMITVGEELRSRGQLEEVGGAAYLVALLTACPTAANIESHARIVRAKSQDRQRILVLETGTNAAYAPDGSEDGARAVVAKLEEIDARAELTNFARYSTGVDLAARSKEVSWLWRNWIPRGFVTCFAGIDGIGKSYAALDLFKRLLLGHAWPDGTPTGVDPASVRALWLDTESSQALLGQRIQDWGLPLERFVFPPDPFRDLKLDNKDDWAWLLRAVRDFNPPLIVIDSLSGSHGGDEKESGVMIAYMNKLSSLAREHDLALVVTHHLRKGNPMEPRSVLTPDDIRGSTGIRQICRSIVGIDKPDIHADTRRFSSMKCNLVAKPEPLGYDIAKEGLAWGEAPEQERFVKPRDKAREFVLERLRSGPCSAGTLENEATEHDANGKPKICSSGTLDKVVADLKRERRIKSFVETEGDTRRSFLALVDVPTPYNEPDDES